MSSRTLATYRPSIQYTPYSMVFTGGTNIANNSLVINSNFNLTSSDFSLFFRLYFWQTNDSTTRMYIWSQTGARGIFGLKGSAPTGAFGIDDGTGINPPFSTIAERGKWYSGVLVYTAATTSWNLYVNGQLDPTTIVQAPASSTNSHILGHHISSTTWGLKGNLCGVYLLKRIVTANEARAWWLEGKIPTVGTYEYKIVMNDGAGNPVDSGPNAYATTKGSSVTWSSTFLPYVARVLRTTRMFTLRNYTNSLKFNGSSGYVTVPANASIQNIWSGGGTVAYWIYPLSTGEGGSGTIIYAADAVSINGWSMRYAASSVIRLVARFSGTNGEWRCANTLLNRWNYVVISYNSDSDANVPTCTVNGVVQTITAVTSPSGTYMSDAGINHIFGNNHNDSRTADAYLCDIMYLGSSLTDAEKQFLTYSGQDSTRSLIERWMFRDGVGATLTGQNGNNGTITTAEWSSYIPLMDRTKI